jgi:hypothetical protein
MSRPFHPSFGECGSPNPTEIPVSNRLYNNDVYIQIAQGKTLG